MENPKFKTVLTPIPSATALEIDAILAKYFASVDRLSQQYWPRSLRNFLSRVVSAILQDKDLFGSCVTKSVLEDLHKDLALPNSHFIKVRDRKTVFSILCHVKLCQKLKLPREKESLSSTISWPTDLEDRAELFESQATLSLRKDIRMVSLGFACENLIGRSF
jgi:hypothetical protein